MRTYAIRRLLLVIPTVLGVSMMTFLLLNFIPGSAIDAIAAQMGQAGMDTTAIEHELGLDVPIYTQYGRWMGVWPQDDGSFGGIFQGDLGVSWWQGEPVAGLIVGRLPVSIELGCLGTLMIVIIGVPLGVYSALRQDTAGDYIGRSLATAAMAVPSFWAGLLVLLAASLWFGMSPPIKALSFTEDPVGHLVQFGTPALFLSMAGVGGIMRMMRSMMLEVLRQDYIRTAWAKGLKERVVVLRHALKNALIPVVTILGAMLPSIVGGTVIMETIFNLPGTGRLLVNAIAGRDYPIVSGVVFAFAIVLVISNIIVDLSYAYLDPRIHYK